jgi:hypothetical protein
MVWPFVALAVLVAYLQFQRYDGLSSSGSDVLSLAQGVVQVVAMTLLGAALFLRHPDAWSRLRPLAIGVILLAAAEAVHLLGPMVDGVLGSSWFSSDGNLTLPASYYVGRAGSIVGIMGAASLLIGFREARRVADPAGTRAILVVLLAIGLGVLVIGYARQILLGAFDGDGIDQMTSAVAIAISAASLIAWTAVASELLAGTRVRERPASAWRVGTIGGFGAAISAVPLLTILPAMDVESAAFWVVVRTVTLIATAAAVLLLVAFLLGLPAPSEAEATADSA